MELLQFADKAELLKKTEIEKIELLAFFLSYYQDKKTFVLQEVTSILVELGAPISNISRLKQNISKSRSFRRIKEGEYLLTNPAKDRIKKYWKVLRSRYYRFADRIVVQCAGFRGFSGGRFIDKCSVIPNPVLEPKVTRPAGTIHTPLRLVSLGRLSKQKNFKWMIDSMELLKKYDSDFTLSIYGSGSEENELRSYIEQKQLRDNVFLKGFVADTYSVLAGSDIYLMTSDYEGFPNALSEAMAVGLPAVSRLCHEGIKSLIDNGKNGFVTALDDMQSFVENIIRLKNDPELYSFIGNNAKTVSDKYNTDKIALLWEKEITDALNRAV